MNRRNFIPYDEIDRVLTSTHGEFYEAGLALGMSVAELCEAVFTAPPLKARWGGAPKAVIEKKSDGSISHLTKETIEQFFWRVHGTEAPAKLAEFRAGTYQGKL